MPLLGIYAVEQLLASCCFASLSEGSVSKVCLATVLKGITSFVPSLAKLADLLAHMLTVEERPSVKCNWHVGLIDGGAKHTGGKLRVVNPRLRQQRHV